MAISTTTNRYAYSGNGVTTVFSYPSEFIANSDLKVIERNLTTGAETVRVLNTHYTVSGAGNPSGGNVTFLSAPASGTSVTIYGNHLPTQLLDLSATGEFPAETIEASLDRLALAIQRALDLAGRSFRLSEGNTETFDTTIYGVLADLAGYVITINTDGDGFTLTSPDDFQGPPGPGGAVGATGSAGADGKTVHTGSGVPSSGLGNDGDIYFDPTAYDFYGPKAGGFWPSAINYQGAAGNDGADGADGAGILRAGTEDLGVGVSSITLNFSTPVADTTYVPSFVFSNLVDADPIFLQGMVTGKTVNGFTVTFNTPTDSLNYKMEYQANAPA